MTDAEEKLAALVAADPKGWLFDAGGDELHEAAALVPAVLAERDLWRWEYEQEKKAGDVWREQATELATELALWRELAECRGELLERGMSTFYPPRDAARVEQLQQRIRSLKERLGEP